MAVGVCAIGMLVFGWMWHMLKLMEIGAVHTLCRSSRSPEPHDQNEQRTQAHTLAFWSGLVTKTLSVLDLDLFTLALAGVFYI